MRLDSTTEIPTKQPRLCECGCGQPVTKGRRFRQFHHQRVLALPLETRFWAKVDKSKEGCWLWTGTRTRGGYGTISLPGGQDTTAPRVSWMIHYGPIPDSHYVCHHCDNPQCVRPDHLFLGTQADNLADMTQKGRRTRGETHACAKLMDEDVVHLRQRYAEGGISLSRLGQMFGVCAQQAHAIVKHQNWKHLP